MTMKDRTTTEDTELQLFEEAPEIAAGTTQEIVHLDLADIEPDPEQPRTDADSDLEDSIRTFGVRQPVTVRPHPDPSSNAKYMLVDGERRFMGSIRAGRTTIPAIVATDMEDALRRFVQQYMAYNEHKRLPPLDEARFFKRVQGMTNASAHQLAHLLKRPKSVILDRLAIADAPPAFARLFDSGAFSASAGPVVRKFYDIPNEILEKVVTEALTWDNWRRPIESGQAIRLDMIASVLDQLIFTKHLVEIPTHLDLAYQGPRVTFEKKQYALDRDEFTRVFRDAEVEKAKSRAGGATPAPVSETVRQAPKAGPAAGGSDLWEGDDADDDEGEPPAPSSSSAKPTRAKAPSLTPAQRKQQDKEKLEDLKRRRNEYAYQVAKPQILRAISAAVSKMSTAAGGPLATYILHRLNESQSGSPYVDLKRMVEVRPRGSSADDFIRFVVVGIAESDIMDSMIDLDGVPELLSGIGIRPQDVNVQEILDGVSIMSPPIDREIADLESKLGLRKAGKPSAPAKAPVKTAAPKKTAKPAAKKKPAVKAKAVKGKRK